jgi:hypothetical protein
LNLLLLQSFKRFRRVKYLILLFFLIPRALKDFKDLNPKRSPESHGLWGFKIFQRFKRFKYVILLNLVILQSFQRFWRFKYLIILNLLIPQSFKRFKRLKYLILLNLLISQSFKRCKRFKSQEVPRISRPLGIKK